MTGDKRGRARHIPGVMVDVELSRSPGPSDSCTDPKRSVLLRAKALVEQEKGTSDGQSMAYIARFAALTVLVLITLGESPSVPSSESARDHQLCG